MSLVLVLHRCMCGCFTQRGKGDLHMPPVALYTGPNSALSAAAMAPSMQAVMAPPWLQQHMTMQHCVCVCARSVRACKVWVGCEWAGPVIVGRTLIVCVFLAGVQERARA